MLISASAPEQRIQTAAAWLRVYASFLMDPPESIKQLCTVGVCTLWCALQFYVNCACLHQTASWKGRNIPSCHQQLVLKALDRVDIQSFALCFSAENAELSACLPPQPSAETFNKQTFFVIAAVRMPATAVLHKQALK